METAEDAEHAEGRQKGGWGLFRFVGVLGLVVIGYVLSIGPVWKLQARQWVDHATFSGVYGPLGVVAGSTPAFGKFLDWYIYDLWKVPGVYLD